IKDQKNYYKVIKGQRYRVIEMNEVLVPLKHGRLSINPVVLKVRIPAPDEPKRRRRRSLFDDPFFDNVFGGRRVVQRTVRSEALTVNVKPLPKKPKTFSGLVGSFELNADLSKAELATSDTATLSIVISGQGVIESMADLELKLDPKI